MAQAKQRHSEFADSGQGRTDAPELMAPELIGPSGSGKGGSIGGPVLVVIGLGLAGLLAAALLGDAQTAPAPERRPAMAALPAEMTPTILEVVPPADPDALERAIAGLLLTPAEREAIGAQVADGVLYLGTLTLRDWKDQDGDMVAITAAGYVQYVAITNVPRTVVIPFAGPGEILVTGARDGEGGITVAVGATEPPVVLRPLFVGESIRMAIP